MKILFYLLLIPFLLFSQNPTAKIVAFWKLDDDGTWADAVGSQNLTDNNGNVGNVSGIVGNAADLPGTVGSYLYHADHDSNSFGNVSMAVTCWAKIDIENAAFSGIVLKDLTSSGNRPWSLTYTSADGAFRFTRGTSAAGAGIDKVVSSASYSVGTWYFLAGWHNATTGRLYIRVYSTSALLAFDSVAVTGTPYDTAINMQIGTLGAEEFAGDIDDLALWNAVPTYGTSTSDLEIIWNSGAGREFPYPDMTPQESNNIYINQFSEFPGYLDFTNYEVIEQ